MGDGALDFDGFCWMGGRNNQPKVGRNYGIYFWETARRAMTIGEAAAALFGPSNYWTKINKRTSSWLWAAANQQFHTTTKLINAGAIGEGFYRARDWRGTQGEQFSISIVLGNSIRSFWGRSSWEGGENNIK
jgi:hypothetical protein